MQNAGHRHRAEQSPRRKVRQRLLPFRSTCSVTSTGCHLTNLLSALFTELPAYSRSCVGSYGKTWLGRLSDSVVSAHVRMGVQAEKLHAACDECRELYSPYAWLQGHAEAAVQVRGN